MVTMAPEKTLLRCKNKSCQKVIMGITGMVEVEKSGIAITRPCPRCRHDNEWKVLPEPAPRVECYPFERQR